MPEVPNGDNPDKSRNVHRALEALYGQNRTPVHGELLKVALGSIDINKYFYPAKSPTDIKPVEATNRVDIMTEKVRKLESIVNDLAIDVAAFIQLRDESPELYAGISEDTRQKIEAVIALAELSIRPESEDYQNYLESLRRRNMTDAPSLRGPAANPLVRVFHQALHSEPSE